MSLRLSIALPNHGILGGGTARGVRARGSNSAIVVVVVVVVAAPRVAFTDCLASVAVGTGSRRVSATHRGIVTLPVVSDNEVLEAGHGWESGTETGRVPTRRADGLVSLVSLVLLVLCRAVTSVC